MRGFAGRTSGRGVDKAKEAGSTKSLHDNGRAAGFTVSLPARRNCGSAESILITFAATSPAAQVADLKDRDGSDESADCGSANVPSVHFHFRSVALGLISQET
jgi:hypothetical protein